MHKEHENTNSIAMKKINKSRIFRLLYKKGALSKQQIAQELNMSRPTITQNLKILSQEDLLFEKGTYDSTGGRKAKIIGCNNSARFAVGIEITKNHVVIVIINLNATIIKNTRIRCLFQRTDDYFILIGNIISEFIEESNCDKSKILGIGIAIPGLMSHDNETVSYAPILGFTNGSLNDFSKYISYPCTLVNDASAAGIAELWNRDTVDNLVYFSLSNSVGGSILVNKTFYPGENQRSGEIGHLTIVPEGQQCYCGQKGCVDVYCNSKILSDSSSGSLAEFFKLLEENSHSHKIIWKQYLYYLSLTINNLRMLMDCRVILGGYVGGYMQNYLADLRSMVSKLNSFEAEGNYVQVCTYKLEASAVGAALSHIEPFINSI